MSSTKRRKLDQDTASNASGTGRGGAGAAASGGAASTSSAAAAAASSSRRGGGGPGSRGGHSAATASRAAAAAAAATTAGPSNSTSGGGGGGGAASGNAHGSNHAAPGSAGLNPADAPYVPVLPLSALPVSALSKYALHYGLIPPEPLTMAQATFPTPALPIELKLATTYTVPATRSSRLTAGIVAGGISDYRRHRSPHPSNNAAASQPSPSTSGAVATVSGRSDRAGSSTPRLGNDAGASTSKANGIAEQEGASGSTTPASAVGGGGGGGGVGKAANDQPNSTAANAAATVTAPNANGTSGNGSTKSGAATAEEEWTEPGEADAQELRGMTAYEGGEEQLRERLGSLARTHWDKLPAVKEAETIVNFAYAIRMRSKILKSAPMV